jgi:hypothetical protein
MLFKGKAPSTELQCTFKRRQIRVRFILHGDTMEIIFPPLILLFLPVRYNSSHLGYAVC